MITHFEATVALLSAVIGMLATLIMFVWKGRGWIDRRAQAEDRLASAIEVLAETQERLHRENQKKFRSIERRLARQ